MTYKILTISDALAPRPKLPYLVESVLPVGSISIFYGYPGSLKSNLVMDMCMAIATGSVWLPARPGSPDQIAGRKTIQKPILWIDLDNGSDVTAERLGAFARPYGADGGTPFFWMSYPTPTIRANSTRNIYELQKYLETLPIIPEVLVIDTLLRAATVKDENSSEMDNVLNNLHKLAEDLKATLIMISHSKKENYGRAGNGLRGHSSIEGGVDSVFYVKRENHSDLVEVENQKARRKPVDPFTVQWTYAVDPISDELETARFYGTTTVKVSKTQQTINDVCQKIIDTLQKNGPLNKKDLYQKVGGFKQNFYDSLSKCIVDQLITVTPGPYNSIIYDAN